MYKREIRYVYSVLPGYPIPRPYVSALAINILNGKSVDFPAVLDTGADKTTLSQAVLKRLNIDPLTLPREPVRGIGKVIYLPFCDFIRISIVDIRTHRNEFPNGYDTVPLYVDLAEGSSNLLGRESFLDLCKVTFDGPKQRLTIEFDF